MVQHELSSNQFTRFEQLEQDDVAVEQQHDNHNGYHQYDDSGTQNTEAQQKEFYRLIYKHVPKDMYTTVQGFKPKQRGASFIDTFCADDIDGIVASVMSHRNDPKTNVYHLCGALTKQPAKGKRGEEDIIGGMSILRADLDIYNVHMEPEDALAACRREQSSSPLSRFPGNASFMAQAATTFFCSIVGRIGTEMVAA